MQSIYKHNSYVVIKLQLMTVKLKSFINVYEAFHYLLIVKKILKLHYH